MRLDILGDWGGPQFSRASLRVEGYLLLALYGVVLCALLYARRGDFRALRGRKLGLFLVLLAATVPLNNILWLRFPGSLVLPPPGVPTGAPPPSVPVLGSVTVVLAGALFGAGPAMVTGLVAGLVQGGLDSSRMFASVELAAFGLVLGFLLHQAYHGRVWRLLRQPLAASLFGAVFRWALLGVNVYAATSGHPLSAFEYSRSLLFASIRAVAMDSLFSGLSVQAMYAAVPGLRLHTAGVLTPPNARSLNRRLLAALIPLMLATMLAMFYAVTTAATNEATKQALHSMEQNAHNASEMVPMLFDTGQGLLKRFASAEQLRSPSSEVRQAALEADIKVGVYGPFFSQLILYDDAGNPVNYYPNDVTPPELSAEEESLLRRTLGFGSPERSHVFTVDDVHLISFIAPVDHEDHQRLGALVGRSDVGTNPTIGNINTSLQGPEGAESGFIVDDRGRIAFHPDEAYVLQPISVNMGCSDISQVTNQERVRAGGRACKTLAYDGTQRLIYYLPVQAMGNWTAVITYPYQMVLERATRISRPLLLIVVALAGLLATTVVLVTRRLTFPLKALATAARSIATGQLDDEVALTEEDEVGQLGNAFEQMRLSLKGRLEDLSLLLRVSQAVSSDLDMSQSIPTILDGALQATDARIARVILLDGRGDPRAVRSQGEGDSGVTALDRAMARLGQGNEPVMIEDVAETRGLIEPDLVGMGIRALIALPMRSKDRDVGVLWLGYDAVHEFDDTEVGFLSTLASQAAVAVDNAQLFQAAEGGRRRLAAILESTGDAVIVTDDADRVLLLNPAAAEAFGTDSNDLSGSPITSVVQEEKLLRLLTASLNGGVPLTDEVLLADGRTLYASASAIVGGDGRTIGRVAVLRDITHLKELDEMKSAFVATVSHDLRRPLTFMLGYAAMIPMVGEVSPKQKLYVQKISAGIEQMTELIDDLLDLRRIEEGMGLLSEPCRLDDIIVSQVDSMRPQAKAQGLTLSLARTEAVTVVVGDASLLRRVVCNLVDNAIKYTPAGGSVTVGWETRGDRVLIWVADTGYGIAKADQVLLFEKFSRIKRPETIHIKGSGLGLAIVKSIVKWHKGRVRVDSELGQGSTFYVELPVGVPKDVES